MHRRVLTLILLVFVGGCDDDKAETEPSSDAGNAIESTLVIHDSFSMVCDTKPGPKNAPAYKKTKGAASPLVIFEKSGETWQSKSSSTMSPWRASDPNKTQLVACVSVKSSKKVRECKFDKEKPVRWVDQHDTSYSIRILEAKTGKELTKRDVDLVAEDTCPTRFYFRKKNREIAHASWDATLLEMVTALQPADAPAPKINHRSLVAACAGKGVLGAKRYEKKAGEISHVQMFHREGDNAAWRAGGFPGHGFKDNKWFTVKSEQYQLVACVTGTRGKKVKDCDFEGGRQVAMFDGSYTVDVYEATTGKKLGTKKLEGKTRRICPVLWNFKPGKNEALADPGKPAKAFLAQWAAP